MSVFGIDLGTTYSCIAEIDKYGNPQVIPNKFDNHDTLASCVFFENSDKVVVGDSAKEMIETDGDRVVEFAKRYIGKPDGPDYTFFEHKYSPIEISSIILKRLKQIAEEQGRNVSDVVITVPAYFGVEERNATEEAGKLAGLNVLGLINEPTAAALSYSSKDYEDNKLVLVYDLGGGTFDVTLVRISTKYDASGKAKKDVEVIASGGNDRLGGKDWDDILFDYIADKFCEENDLEVSTLGAYTKQNIQSNVEKIKKDLSKRTEVSFTITGEGIASRMGIKRETFESITASKLKKTFDYISKLLTDQNYPQVDMVLLVGGSTYMPQVKTALEQRFPGKIVIDDPDRAVAKGAAIFANMLKPKSKGYTPPEVNGYTPPDDGETEIYIRDKTSRSFGPGVFIEGSYLIDNIIKIGEDIPAQIKKNYYPIYNNQKSVLFSIFESMSKDDEVVPCINENGEFQQSDPEDMVKLLGKLELFLPPNTSCDTPIETMFKIDAGGIYVKARNTHTNDEVDVYIQFESTIDIEKSPVRTLCISPD